MKPEDMIKRRARKIVDSGALSQNSIPLAHFTETIIVNDNLEALTEAIKSIPSVVIPESVEISNLQEYPSEMAISNLPEIQRVEIVNHQEKDDKETQKLLKELVAEVKKKEQYAYDIEIDSTLKEQLKGDRGKDGENGKDGVEITGEEIVEKIETIGLPMSSVKDLDETIATLQNRTQLLNQIAATRSNGGGIQSVVAGTNVTVDNADPLNPIINANDSVGIPATTVVAETTYGLSTVVGTSTNYAREDHSHGSQNNPVGGTDTQVQFNDGGVFGGDTKFSWDKTASALKIGEGVTPLPNNPLAVQANVDSYLQINLKNDNAGVDSSSDYIATADDGDDTQFYSDIGICNSGYASTAWDAVVPHDTYVFGDGGNVAIASLSVGKKIPFFIAATEHEIHPADLRAEVDSSGINLPTGKTYRINGVDILASGMSNPMTAVGDMIVGGAAGTPTTLPVGTNGEVLTLVAGTPSWEAAASFTTEEAQDAVGAMADSESLVYADATPLLSVKVQQSITKDASGLKLSGDSSSPGNNQVYGTDASGVKGWKADPSSGSGFSKDTIGVTVDGGGSVITTGSKGYKVIQEACTITGWTILGKESGSVVVDIKKCTYAGFPTTSTITGTEKPTLSSTQKNQDLTLTTWTTSLAEGDILEFIVDSASTCTRFNLFINITK